MAKVHRTLSKQFMALPAPYAARACVRPRAIGAFAAAAAIAFAAPANSQQLSGTTNAQHEGENGEAAARRQSAVVLALTYNSDANYDVTGGARTGGAYLQRLGLIADADLSDLLGWRGASAHFSVHAIQGQGLSAHRVGNLLTVSGIEAEPALRLFNAWIEQKTGSGLAVRVGQFTAAQEFAISSTANLFINSTFGWPGSFATDLPSGGPAYPLAGPGARIAAQPNPKTLVRAAVFSGDPAGRGAGDPQRRDLHGFNGFRFKGRPFAIAEIVRSSGGAEPLWSATFGGWVHFDRFRALSPSMDGSSPDRAEPASFPRLRGNRAVYLVGDGLIWRRHGRSLRGFARFSASPAGRNPIDIYVDAGLTLAGLFRSRSQDVLGFGVAVARISPSLRAADPKAPGTGGLARVAGYEGVIEASYQVHASGSVAIQPNAQLVLNPSGWIEAPGTPPPRETKAFILGVRTSVRL